MAIIDLRFINVADGTDADGVEGYQFSDFFCDNGLERAEKTDSLEEASVILAKTYKGADTEGVGVEFSVYND